MNTEITNEQVINDAGAPKPVAIVQGEPLAEIPTDLYIPPNALEVILEAFTGPLDLLLYLIKKQNIDILDIPVAKITECYMEYVELMKQLQLELAAEYLVMAATLAEIKSRMLLPKPVSLEDGEEDPRAELVRRLREYEKIKKAAEDLDGLPRLDRDIFSLNIETPEIKIEQPLPTLNLQEMLFALKDVLKRASMYSHHLVKREILSVRERMSHILSKLEEKNFLEFENMFDVKEGKMGVVVTFVAILELIKESLIDMVQAAPYGQIYLKKITGET
ncbi:MAG: segregation/condensation protein A [Gammaproteobacteria bacterium]|nr:segregation/condensation protein A [Gammaproteobacteria bacterium]